MTNHPNRGIAHSVPTREFRVGNNAAQGKNLSGLLLCEFRHVVIFSAKAATLIYLILFVLFVFSEEQVIRVAARRYVTTMQYMKAIWNLSEVSFPCNAMGVAMPLVDRALTVRPAGRHDRAHPNPATGLGDAFYAIFDVLLRGSELHDTSNKGDWPVSRVGRAGPLSLFPVTQV